jgi:hypothetical protein
VPTNEAHVISGCGKWSFHSTNIGHHDVIASTFNLQEVANHLDDMLGWHTGEDEFSLEVVANCVNDSRIKGRLFEIPVEVNTRQVKPLGFQAESD